MYVPHELFNRIDQEYMCREHIQCTIIIRVLLFVPHAYMCKCSYVCGFVYAVDRLRDLSRETKPVYANAVKQPGNPGLVRVKVKLWLKLECRRVV